MKKMLFLMLFLGILGTVGTNAQVRIGGNGQPNAAAVLDLNATDAINNGTKGLALPRVSLTDINTALTGSPTVNGMMVYNTNASVTGGSGAGIYYWDGSEWQIVGNTAPTYTGSTSITLSGDSFQRAALTGAITADANSNVTRIAAGAVDSLNLAKNSVGLSRLRVVRFNYRTSLIPAGGYLDTNLVDLPDPHAYPCLFNTYNINAAVDLRFYGPKLYRIRNLDNWGSFVELFITCFVD